MRITRGPFDLGETAVQLTTPEYNALRAAAHVLENIRGILGTEETADTPYGTADAALAEILYGMDPRERIAR